MSIGGEAHKASSPSLSISEVDSNFASELVTSGRVEVHIGVLVPWAFKLDHLQPIKPLYFPNFYKFFTFILKGQFLLPQRANNGKREFTQL